MNIDELSKAIWDVHRTSVGYDVGSECKPGDSSGKCKKNRRRQSVFPVLYPGHMGTPRTFNPGSANDSLQTGGTSGSIESVDGGGVGGTGHGRMSVVTERGSSKDCRPSRVRILHEMKRSMGMLEGGANPDPSWGGFSVPGIGMTKIRGDGPQISGPGFRPDDRDGGGRYDFRRSPGIGFRTETAWRIWMAALNIIDRDKTATKVQILMQAIQKAGLHRGQIDPAELRLLEMGIEWYLTSPGALAGGRGAGATVSSGGSLAGPGAP